MSTVWCCGALQSTCSGLSTVIYLLCEALQALVSAADHNVLPDSDQTHWMRRQLDAVLWFVGLPEEQHKQLFKSTLSF